MMVSGLDANASSVADIRKGRVGSEHYGPENIQGLKISRTRCEGSRKGIAERTKKTKDKRSKVGQVVSAGNNANLINSLDDSSSKEVEYFDEEQVVLWRPLLPPSI
ncbi:hypothetical protein Tco_0829433 [Tanacetum coccineum]